MSEGGVGEQQSQGKVRLRIPERLQYAMLPQCLDDLVSKDHSVRTVMAVVEKLDLSDFCEPIKAREGVAGRDATDPVLLVALWLCTPRCAASDRRESWRVAVRRALRSAGCAEE